MAELTKTVATPSETQARIAERAEIVRVLMSGTVGMRAAGKKYLPSEKAEQPDAYKLRLAQSVLFGATEKTVEDMTGRVFAKPIVLKDDVPARIKEFAENIDLAGRHINVFARDVFADAMQPGISYIHVDMPVAAPGVRTVADEQAAGVRPYLVSIPAERLIGWKSETVGGREVLTQVRISEIVTEADGEFHEKSVEQIRVLEPGTWRTFRKVKDDWIEHDSGTNSLPVVPIVPVYTRRVGFMEGAPPLEKLAHLNVAHWQSASDQRHILHFARVPVMFATGWDKDDEIIIGPNSLIRSTDPAAKIGIVEHSGAAITAGRDDLKDLEFQMQAMGLTLLVPQAGARTAAGEMRDDAKENAPLAMMARSLGDALEEAFGLMARYLGLGDDAGGEVDVNKDFGIQSGAAADIQHLIAARAARLISHETFLEEMLRRGFLSDSLDIEVELSRIESEAPELDGGPNSPPLDDPDE